MLERTNSFSFGFKSNNMRKSIETILKQYSFNTRLFKNVLEGINDEESTKRLTDNINHLRWIAGHLTMGRYRNIMRTGLQAEVYPHIDKFIKKDTPPPNAVALDVNMVYPSLEESMRHWNMYSEVLENGIPTLSEDALAAETPFRTIMGGNTVLDALEFVAMHEQYHIGQMSVIRRALGHSAMSFM
jgi:uncharacterized damage-inducible protein DinB